jgi:hypothetical protein
MKYGINYVNMSWSSSTLSCQTRLDKYPLTYVVMHVRMTSLPGALASYEQHLKPSEPDAPFDKARRIVIGRLANFFWAKQVLKDVNIQAPPKDIMTEPSTQPTLTPQFCFSTVALRGMKKPLNVKFRY